MKNPMHTLKARNCLTNVFGTDLTIKHMHKSLSAFVIIIATLFLSACSTTPEIKPPANQQTQTPPASWPLHQSKLLATTDWQLSGKIGIATPTQSQSGYIDWTQNNDLFSIEIRGTLGFGGLDLEGNESLVTIKVDENNTRTLPTDIAMQRYLEWEFPINALKYWAKGIPTPDTPASQTLFSPEGYLVELHQHDWRIQLKNYEKHNGLVLPHKIIARGISSINKGYKISLVLSDWHVIDTP
jgi:outer membrane lipoprotein LolB